MNTKEKAAWLADLYQHVADGGMLEDQYAGTNCWRDAPDFGPSWHSKPKDWRKKPMAQVVDLSVLIESGIDCEFWNTDSPIKFVVVGRLTLMGYERNSTDWHARCRPRLNHIHAWQGGECPLPAGGMVKFWTRDSIGEHFGEAEAVDLWWGHSDDSTCGSKDIIAFEVLPELAPNFIWPWEVEA